MPDILFIQNYYEQMLGIMHISAVLKQHGYTAEVAIGSAEQLLAAVQQKKPRLVGFYCTTGFHHKNLALALKIKQLQIPGLLIIFGGPHPTFVPELIHEEGVDIICRGEGEYAVLELLQALKDNHDYTAIKNLTVKIRGQIFENPLRPPCNIDRLPFPDRELYSKIDHIYLSGRQEVMLGRGCPFSCNFCSAAAYRELYRGIGTHVRLRSVDVVLDELKSVQRRYRPSCFFFHDDTFTPDSAYGRAFLEKYRQQINLPFSCLVRADLVTDDYVAKLRAAGCYLVAFGVESGNQALRSTILKKNIADEQIINCAALLHKHGIPFATFNMVGVPGESLANVWETVDLNARIKPIWAWFSLYQTLPQTGLADYALERGYVKAVDVAPADASFHETSNLLRAHPEGRQIIRLKACANILVRFPLLKNLTSRFLLNNPVDSLLELVEKTMYFSCYYRKLTYKMSLYESMKSALFIFRRLKEFK